MRKIILALMILNAGLIYAQQKDMSVFKVMRNDSTVEYKVYSVFYTDTKPHLKNTDTPVEKVLYENIKYPQEAIDNNIEGTVYVSFIVNEEGKISEKQVIKSVHEALDNEALRVIDVLPEWEPGKVGDKPVAVEFILPIRFYLKEE